MDYDEIMVSRAATDGPRRVIGWTSYTDVETRALKEVGGWGGFMTAEFRWSEFIEDSDAEETAYLEALRAAILERGLRRGGDWHQRAGDGIAVFDDGAVASFSFRGWGDLMAAVWSDHDGRGYGYMDFYMDSLVPSPNPPLEAG